MSLSTETSVSLELLDDGAAAAGVTEELEADRRSIYPPAADLERIITYGGLPHIKRATVVGGGLLGLEAAKAVYDMHEIEEVSIINRTGYPLSRQLDSSAGEIVLRRIEAMGVKVSPPSS